MNFRQIIDGNPLAVAVVLKKFHINKKPTFDIALAAYIKFGEPFLYALYSEITGTSNWFGRNRKKDPKPAKQQETQKKKRDWDKFRKEANGWVNLAGNLASAGVGVFQAIKNDNAQTNFSYSDDESGFNMTTRSGNEEKSFLEKNMLFIGLAVVALLFFMLNK